MTVALNHQYINNHPKKIYNITPYIKQYHWNEIQFPPHKKDWSKIEKNNNTIALNVLFVPYNTKQIRLAYILKYNSNRENQVILLTITDGKKWHYLFVKRLSTLLNRMTRNYEGGFYCLNCFYSFRTENAL